MAGGAGAVAGGGGAAAGGGLATATACKVAAVVCGAALTAGGAVEVRQLTEPDRPARERSGAATASRPGATEPDRVAAPAAAAAVSPSVAVAPAPSGVMTDLPRAGEARRRADAADAEQARRRARERRSAPAAGVTEDPADRAVAPTELPADAELPASEAPTAAEPVDGGGVTAPEDGVPAEPAAAAGTESSAPTAPAAGSRARHPRPGAGRRPPPVGRTSGRDRRDRPAGLIAARASLAGIDRYLETLDHDELLVRRGRRSGLFTSSRSTRPCAGPRWAAVGCGPTTTRARPCAMPCASRAR